MRQLKTDDVISNLELNIRWIEDIPAHQFAGYGNVVMAMRDAAELLKERFKTAKWVKKTCDCLYCSNCDMPSMNKQRFCCGCGAKMTDDVT